MKPIKLTVKTKSEIYPIIIGQNIIKDLSKYFNRNSITFNQCLLIVDNKVPNRMVFKITKSLKRKKIFKFFFDASEKNKSQISINKILQILLYKNFSRQDCIISIGGGITGDVSGFAASLYKRGLQFINLPTTLLSQVDSSIGGKTGINKKEGKNLIGSFYQPKIVISDTEFLKSLPRREIICGYGEILKHSLISNKKFFLFLNKNASKILDLKTPFIEKSIKESCLIKKNIIQIDEKEKNLRKVLNFGHTFAHAYEAVLKYSKKLNHGEAVLLGIMSASKFSLKQKLLNKNEFELIKNHLTKFKLPNDINNNFTKKNLNQIISFMEKDKKNNNQKINLVLLKKIGSPHLGLNFQNKELHSFLKKELIN